MRSLSTFHVLAMLLCHAHLLCVLMLPEGRQIPIALINPSTMLAVSEKAVMRLILLNQTKINQLFAHYQVDDHVSRDKLAQFAEDFNLIPGWCSQEQLDTVFTIVNESEA